MAVQLNFASEILMITREQIAEILQEFDNYLTIWKMYVHFSITFLCPDI